MNRDPPVVVRDPCMSSEEKVKNGLKLLCVVCVGGVCLDYIRNIRERLHNNKLHFLLVSRIRIRHCSSE